jgi:hypothetical protein
VYGLQMSCDHDFEWHCIETTDAEPWDELRFYECRLCQHEMMVHPITSIPTGLLFIWRTTELCSV